MRTEKGDLDRKNVAVVRNIIKIYLNAGMSPGNKKVEASRIRQSCEIFFSFGFVTGNIFMLKNFQISLSAKERVAFDITIRVCIT